ncbi:MAG TPA: hypothetical protein VHZ31_01045 [Solirubrobacteraceae bacterium]|nr:hypothetical protein [Solirubrobacteraceae bacterium]
MPSSHATEPAPAADDVLVAARVGTVRLDYPLPGIVVLTLRGDHDSRTWPDVLLMLRRTVAIRDVLIDLSDCTRLDLSDLTDVARPRGRDENESIDVVLPFGGPVEAWPHQVDLGTVTLHESRPHALAEMARR